MNSLNQHWTELTVKLPVDQLLVIKEEFNPNKNSHQDPANPTTDETPTQVKAWDSEESSQNAHVENTYTKDINWHSNWHSGFDPLNIEVRYNSMGIYSQEPQKREVDTTGSDNASRNNGIGIDKVDYKVSIYQTPNDQLFILQDALNNTGQTGGTPDADIDAPEAWDITTGNSDVVVAVIDTGIDYDHPDLAANIWINPGEIPGNGMDDDSNGYVDDVHGWNFVKNNKNPDDDHGHGTHVAGIIGAVGNNSIGVAGVAWNVKLMPLKVLDRRGRGFTSDVIEAINYAAHRADVINLSLGSNNFSQGMKDAIANASALVVAAAGNDGNNNDETPSYPASYDLDNIIAVAATNHKDKLTGFSNYGATSVDLAAPGNLIASTYRGGRYAYMSGTSMATPHVSGGAALVMAAFPELNVDQDQVKDQILGGVDPIPSLQGITVTGGRLNAFNSLNNNTSSQVTEILGLGNTDFSI